MFSNGSNEKITFAKFNSKLGAFVIRSKIGDKVEKASFSQVRDVVITKVSTKDDAYEGVPYTELQLRVKGADGVAQLSFNVATGACAKLVSILNGADLTKPMGFSGQLLKAGTVVKGFGDEPLKSDFVSISVWQGDKFLKPTVDVPKVVMVKVGNKEVADTSLRDAFTNEQIAMLIAKMGASVSHAEAESESEAEAGQSGMPPDDDLPF